jgi:sulfopyruvate decarboxylase subunit beta
MSTDKKIADDLIANGVRFVTTVPCKQLAGVIDEIDRRPEIMQVPSNTEDEAMGLCAGAFMGGRRPAIIMQNTALGVTSNTLATLIQFYRMPLPMLISYRGELSGITSQELHAIDDQPTNFYTLGTMGLASSIGLGLALAQPKKMIAIDGDGSVLTNLGTLPTIGNNPADNYILFIIDNGSYGSTGDQPTYAGRKTSLSAVARACGCDHFVECRAEDTRAVLEESLAGDRMTVIVCKCHSGNAKMPVITMDPVVIRDRFMRCVRA